MPILLLYYLFEIDLKEEVFNIKFFKENVFKIETAYIIITSISLVFWNMNNVFHRKWKYCADLYNQYLFEESRVNKNEKEKLDIIVNSLAIDLFHMDLWAHRSFAELFYDELKSAIKDHSSDNSLSKEFTESEVIELLEKRHHKLLRQGKRPEA